MWLNYEVPECKFDTIECTDCGACKPSPLALFVENLDWEND